MTLPERILQTIADPNIAYILLTIGVIGIIAELYDPGSFFPGIVGAISLILAFVAFGNLPINWAGVLLILLAIGLIVAELYSEGIGILAVVGIVAFVLGSLLLYTPVTPISPAMPEVRVSPWLVASMAAGLAGFFLLVLRALLQSRRAPIVTRIQALTGRIGVAVTDLTPAGTVRVDTEVMFRLGRVIGAVGPVLVLMIPLVDRGVRVDLRERFFDVPPQTCITEDNASVSIDFLVYMKIVDALPNMLNVEDFEGAARGIAITTLRAVVGDMLLDEALAKREQINESLRGKLDEVTNR